MNTSLPWLRRAAASVLAAVVGWSVLAAVPASADDASWTVRTAANSYGAARTSFSYALNPGASATDGMVVANHGSEPLDLSVYAADGYTTASGQLDLLTAGQQSTGVGAWTHADAGTVTIAPGKSRTVGFSISVPANAGPGDYVGGIVTTLSSTNDAGVSVDRRLGIRIGIRVGGDLTPSMTVENVGLAWTGGLNPFAGGDATVTFTLRNTGNAVLDSQTQATVSGPFGWFAVTEPVTEATPKLLPGETWTRSVQVSPVMATFAIFCQVSTAPLVVDASGSTTPLTTITGSAAGVAVPWTALLMLVLLAGVVVAAVLFGRRRRARQDARVEQAVREAVAAATAGGDEASEPGHEPPASAAERLS